MPLATSTRMAFVNGAWLVSGRHTQIGATSGRRVRSGPRAAVVPLGDRILVRVDEKVSQTSGGLFLGSEEDSKRPTTGTVIAVGDGRFSAQGQREVIDVAVGDHVLWKDDYGVEVIEGKLTDGDGELLAMKIFNIAAKW